MLSAMRWKVVTKDRLSVTVPASSKYCNRYVRGEIISSLDGTLGLFCFNKMRLAEAWIKTLGMGDLKIIRVIPCDTSGTVPSLVSVSNRRDFRLDKYYDESDRVSFYPPEGTICYKELKIFD